MSELVRTDSYPYGKYSFENFNPVQSKVINLLETNSNVIVASPTASGKTICGEILAGKMLANGQKVIYTSPLKALVEEKIEEWTHKDHPWSGRKHFVMTGDYKMTATREEEVNEAEVIVCTYEMLSVRSRRSSIESLSWISNAGVLVIDEAHFISSEGRGDHLEAALIGFSRLNPEARIVFLSATMRNCHEIAAWLTKLNGRQTDVVESDYRPCKLTLHFRPFKYPPGVSGASWKRYEIKENLKLDTLAKLLDEYPEDNWLIFVHSKAAGRKIYSTFPAGKVAFHNADLSSDKRREIERMFKEGKLQYLIATSTLAYGLNLPARRVAIFGVDRGFDEVDALDIIQECGRAGRPRYDKEGDAYIIIEQSQLESWTTNLQCGVDVKSKLHKKIGFHLIGEIVENRIRNTITSIEWGTKTLSDHQGLWRATEVGSLFSSFEKEKLIEKSAEDWDDITKEVFKATRLGKIASHHYFDPFDVSDWKKNIWNVRSRELFSNPIGLSWMITNIGTNNSGYVPKEMRELTNKYLIELKRLNLFVRGDTALTKGSVLWQLLIGRDTEASKYPHIKIPLISDAERIVSCLEQIDKIVLGNKDQEFWDSLTMRIRYGVSEKAAELCRLDGIGKQYAETLIFNGIDSIKDFFDKVELVKDTLPNAVYEKAYQSAKKILHPVESW